MKRPGWSWCVSCPTCKAKVGYACRPTTPQKTRKRCRLCGHKPSPVKYGYYTHRARFEKARKWREAQLLKQGRDAAGAKIA